MKDKEKQNSGARKGDSHAESDRSETVPVRSYSMSRRSEERWIEENASGLRPAEKPARASKNSAPDDPGVRKKARVLLAVITVAAVLLVTVPAVWLLLSNRLVITGVTVEGETSYSAEELLEASGLREGDSVFSARPGKNASRVLEKLAFLKKCEVSVTLPGTVVFRVEEYGPAAYLRSGDSLYILSEELLVLGRSDGSDAPDGLIELGAPQISKCLVGKTVEFADGNDFGAVCAALEALSVWQTEAGVVKLDASDRFRMKALLGDGTEVLIGSKSGLDVKLATAGRLIEEGVKPGSVIDVSVEGNGFISEKSASD